MQLDGKSYDMDIASDDLVLDAALNHGLDLPYSCKGGVCCTCRAKVMEGQVEMAKNFTLSDEEIDAYISSNEPMGKAGAYGIQGIGGCLISSISGSYSGIMGLPLFETSQLLNETGVQFSLKP